MGAQVHKHRICQSCGSNYLHRHQCQTGEIELFACDHCGTFVADGTICECLKNPRLEWNRSQPPRVDGA